MKKIVSVLLVFCVACACVLSYAEGIDLTVMTKEELESLRERINEEIKSDHALTSSEQSKLDDTAKAFVEELFKQNNMTVSWAWFDYDHTRDWGYATMSTHFDAKDANKKTTRFDVTVGAYLQNDEWTVIYLMLNNEVLYDLRSQIPDPRLNPEADEAAAIITPEPTPSPTPIPIELPTNTPTPEPTATPSPTPTQAVTSKPTEATIPESTKARAPEANEDPVGFMVWIGIPEEIASDREYSELHRGDKGDNVRALQNDLIYLGILKGTADGDYGKKTEDAVRQYQKECPVDATGIADLETQAWIRIDVYENGGYGEMVTVEEPVKKQEKMLPKELQFGTLLSVIETGENDIIVIKAKIESSYSNKSTVDQNYYNIEYMARKYGLSRYNTVDYWAVADMNDGSEQKVVAFTVPKDVVQNLADGKIPANQLGDYVNDLWIHPALR